MLAIVQDFKKGDLMLVEAPAPSLSPGCALVRNHFSFVSPGTEISTLRFAKKSLVGKAFSRKDLMAKVIEKVKRDGLRSAFKSAMTRLEEPLPLGYSCAGTVEAVSPEVSGLRPGDLVACAGGGYACHAEAVIVPANLAVKIPEGVTPRDASSVALGAIALEAYRIAGLHLGEVAVVMGLGIIGQILVRILRSAGCAVFAYDPDAASSERAAGIEGVRTFSDISSLEANTIAATDGHGADCVIIAASTESNEPVEAAPRMLRKRGSVVVLGVSGLDIPRKPYYEKELDIRFSTSYGPGRYDPQYEEHGRDYPIEHARWTENRNMSSYLRLLADGSVSLDSLVDGEFPIGEGPSVYEKLEDGQLRSAVFSYDTKKELAAAISIPTHEKSAAGTTKFAMLGSGTFARSVLLPNLVRLGAKPTVLCTATPARASVYAKKYGFEKAATDAAEALKEDVAFTVIATPHAAHAAQLKMALEKNRPVFCEKPLAINKDELSAIVETYGKTKTPFMAGFNRRFAPAVAVIAKEMPPGTPALISYIVNAGKPDKQSWVAQPQQGGRIAGEVCHFVDTCIFLAGSPVESVFATSHSVEDPPDECAATLRFRDGSVAQIIYSVRAAKLHPKERIEMHRAGKVAVVDNFRKLTITAKSRTTKKFASGEKGHHEELRHFMDALAGKTSLAENVKSSLAATAATLAIIDSLRSNAPVSPPSFDLEEKS